MNNCFCIDNYVNKIKENLLGKSIILGPVVSFFVAFSGPRIYGTENKFSPLLGRALHEHWLSASDTSTFLIVNSLKFYFPLVRRVGQFAYALCRSERANTSTLDKFQHFLRAIKAVYFMFNILNPRNNTTNCSVLFCFFSSHLRRAQAPLNSKLDSNTHARRRETRREKWAEGVESTATMSSLTETKACVNLIVEIKVDTYDDFANSL